MLSLTSPFTYLKISLHSLLLPGLVACNNACEMSQNKHELYAQTKVENIKWDYDEITQKLIVNNQADIKCSLPRYEADTFKVRSIIVSVTGRI